MMRIAEALEAFRPLRADAVVVPGRGGRFWTDLTGNEKLDAPVGDPAMGGHAGFGLGLALARPERKVVLFDSEGDILMSLGMLTTIAEQAPPNFYHFLLDNEVYATTGGQPVPNAKIVAYDKMALAAGYPRAHSFEDSASLAAELPAILSRPGPVFIWLKVYPEIENEPIGRRRRWQTRTREQVGRNRVRLPGEGRDPLVSRSCAGNVDTGLRRYDENERLNHAVIASATKQSPADGHKRMGIASSLRSSQ